MRVIAGTARGRKLRPVPGDSTRPITDRVKESLFNIIGPDIQGANFLDSFAGTGSVGIEALSRGAAAAFFIDLKRQAIETVKFNLNLTRLSAHARVIRGDVFTFLEKPAVQQFDYVYIAPPQYQGIWKKMLLLVDQRLDWLTEDAWVIVQIHPREIEDIELSKLVEFDRRNYGSTLLIFFQPKMT
ncbi:MAG: 16S rRNA (guanine(966)-N(2))-methyltransferase RsmD [Chloroflexota bacterium]|nr:MAG: 16S rRNA (guanine(966)-N(2))-methyltransferase RsmD [Chloroflexota bacterium]